MFTIKRPTPTTVLYTVSTRAVPKTLTAHFHFYVSLLLRLLAGLIVLLVLLHESRTFHASALFGTSALARLDAAVSSIAALAGSPFTSSPPGSGSGSSLTSWTSYATSPRLLRLAACAAVTYLVARRGYTEESLLVIRGLGVQTATSSSSYFWSSTTRFIPSSSIQDIFVHEAFRGFEVRFYLGIVVEGEEGVVVVFPNLLPRREILEAVWRGAKACLYEPKT